MTSSGAIRVHRSEWREEQATRIPSEVIQDPQLDPFTLGVLVRLLRQPAGRPVTAYQLWLEGAARPAGGYRETKAVYRTAFGLLDAAGYGDRLALPLVLGFPPKPRRKDIPRRTVRAVWDRDGWECVKCGKHRNLTVGHIIPVALGGTDEMGNLQTECGTCNFGEGNQIARLSQARRKAASERGA